MVTATQPSLHNKPCKTGAKENSRCLAVLVRMRSWKKRAHLLNRLNTASRVRHSRIPRKRENYIQKCFQPFYDNYNISYVLTLKAGQIELGLLRQQKNSINFKKVLNRTCEPNKQAEIK